MIPSKPVLIVDGNATFRGEVVDNQEPPAEVRLSEASTQEAAFGRRLDFESIPDLVQGGEIELVNGREPVNPAMWAAVAIASDGYGYTCTATLIGPRVMLTAAHCVDLGDPPGPGVASHTLGGSARFGGSPIAIVSCEMHPDYVLHDWYGPGQTRSSEDVALCELIAPTAGIVMESVETNLVPVAGNKVMMTGYGCTGFRVEGNVIKPDLDGGTLRLGDATIDGVGVGRAGLAHGAYLRTVAKAGEAVLCPGDSGGPAFHGASVDRQDAPGRRIIAVNSRLDAYGPRFESYASMLANARFRAFQQAWSAKSAGTRQVCGIGIAPGSGNCRR